MKKKKVVKMLDLFIEHHVLTLSEQSQTPEVLQKFHVIRQHIKRTLRPKKMQFMDLEFSS